MDKYIANILFSDIYNELIKQEKIKGKADKRENLQEAADAFMLIFYLIGINIIDLLRLTELTSDNRKRPLRIFT
jgi:hypothetical protein